MTACVSETKSIKIRLKDHSLTWAKAAKGNKRRKNRCEESMALFLSVPMKCPQAAFYIDREWHFCPLQLNGKTVKHTDPNHYLSHVTFTKRIIPSRSAKDSNHSLCLNSNIICNERLWTQILTAEHAPNFILKVPEEIAGVLRKCSKV